LMLIDDGSIHSLWIHRLDGSRATLQHKSQYGTPETIYRIRKACISYIDDNAFLLTATLSSLSELPAYWPE
jgi:hypothetical protein